MADPLHQQWRSRDRDSLQQQNDGSSTNTNSSRHTFLPRIQGNPLIISEIKINKRIQLIRWLQLLTDRIRAESMQFAFQLKPGDLVAFNNHRILHGRTAYDQSRVSRHLEGCYVEIDETMATFGSLLNEWNIKTLFNEWHSPVNCYVKIGKKENNKKKDQYFLVIDKILVIVQTPMKILM